MQIDVICCDLFNFRICYFQLVYYYFSKLNLWCGLRTHEAKEYCSVYGNILNMINDWCYHLWNARIFFTLMLV